jgi:hypothetical protein
MMKAGHEVNHREEQDSRRECVMPLDAQSCRSEVEPVQTRSVVLCETGANKVNLAESNAGSKEEIVTFPHVYSVALVRSEGNRYRE